MTMMHSRLWCHAWSLKLKQSSPINTWMGDHPTGIAPKGDTWLCPAVLHIYMSGTQLSKEKAGCMCCHVCDWSTLMNMSGLLEDAQPPYFYIPDTSQPSRCVALKADGGRHCPLEMADLYAPPGSWSGRWLFLNIKEWQRRAGPSARINWSL